MTWALIADSSCNLRDYHPTAQNCIYAVAPLTIRIDNVDFIDDSALDILEFNQALEDSRMSSSACPSIGEWEELFRLADNTIAIAMSPALSGSYEAAYMAASLISEQGAEPRREHNVFVLNTRAAGAKLEVIVEMLDRYLLTHQQASFEEVAAYAERLESTSQVLYSLSEYDNLVKGGRMPKLAGSLAGALNIRMLGTASEKGTISVVGPTRGAKKAFHAIIEHMREDGYRGGLVYIDHVCNEHGASVLKSEIQEVWPEATVRIAPAGGICTYYAEQSGLIVGYEWL